MLNRSWLMGERRRVAQMIAGENERERGRRAGGETFGGSVE
jgi:hypothetical protein